MTERQRKKLEWLGSNASAGYVLDDNDRCEIRAALADLDACRDAVEPREVLLKARLKALQDTRANLDACRAALRPVAIDLRRWNYLARTYDNIPVGLTRSEAEAVLAAAWEEQT